MRAPNAPPLDPRPATWEAIPAGARSLLVRATRAGYEAIAPAPRLAVSLEGRTLVALTLLLSRTPAAADAALLPLVVSGSLALTVTIAAEGQELDALAARFGGPVSPCFVRGGAATLRDDTTVYARYDVLGSGAQLQLGCVLPPAAAVGVLAALDGAPTPLRVRVELPGPDAPALREVPLVELLGGVHALDGSSRVAMVVLHADGSFASVPPVLRDVSPAPRDAVPLRLEGTRALALPFAMTAASHVSAAALIAGGGSASPVAAGPNLHVYPVHDVVAELDTVEGEGAPSQHLPLVGADAAGPTWPDALDASKQWCLPTLALVAPGPHDDAATAPYRFAFARAGVVVGGGAQPGLTGSVRFTFRAAIPDGTPAGATPVPIGGVTAALEFSYRQSGSATYVTQRFPATVTQSGDDYVAEVPLLDDFVRLGYAALAYPPAADAPPPRLVVDFAFAGYAWIWVRIPTDPGDAPPVHGPLGHPLLAVNHATELPSQVVAPTLVKDRLAVVAPTSYVQYEREAPGATRDLAPLRFNAHAIDVAALTHPLPAFVVPGRRVLSSRSYAAEVKLPCAFPCASTPGAYLQIDDRGTATPVGCQDALRLGETALTAFAELPALRDPAFRVYRSLQQPARFLLVPTGYRVGRYGARVAGRAFRPMVELYGQLDPDPAKSRYALTATLIPDVTPAALARLAAALAGEVPARAAPSIVYPTDPFAGASVRFAWTVPTGLDPPQAMTVVDAVVVIATMGFDDALLVMTLLDRTGLLGAVTFTLPDGTAFTSALTVDGDAVGPPESGPVVVTLAGTTATLVNRTQTPMHVTDVVAVAASGAPASVAADQELAPGAGATVTVPAGTSAAFADATPAAHQSIEELDVFVDDVTVQVTFINQVALANHQLTALGVTARLEGLEHVESAALPESGTATVGFTLPITDYLAHRTLQYALVETRAAGTTTTAWRDWNLTTGSIVGVTADQV